MDLGLIVFLFLCFCQQSWTKVVVLKHENDTAIGLIPLVTSSPQTDIVSSNVSHTEELLPDDFSTSISDIENAESSSEEILDESCSSWSSTEVHEAVGRGVMKFGLELLENLKADPKQSNIIISPLSVALALSQLALGARNDTQELLLQCLHANNVPCYHKALKNLLLHIRKTALQIANRIYLANGFNPNPAFIEESFKIYDSKPAVLTDLAEINEWIEKSTNGHVTDFLSSLPPNLVMMLINAVFYKELKENIPAQES